MNNLTLEEKYILIDIIITRGNIDIQGIQKLEIQKDNYRKLQRVYIEKRKNRFNQWLNFG